MIRQALVAALAAIAISGCSFTPNVTRLVDGRFRDGAFVPPGAYDAFVNGALAEADGRDADAAAAYEATIDHGPVDALPHTRLAAVLARRGDPKAAEREIDRALAIDPDFGPALALRARLAAARGDRTRAAATHLAAVRAAPMDASTVADAIADDSSAALASEAATTDDAGAEVWLSVLSWAEARDQFALSAQAATWLATHAPDRTAATESAAQKLAKRGAPRLAERVAAATVDARPTLGRRPLPPLVARLAVDEALRRGDAERALARATRGRVSRAEVATRAALVGRMHHAHSIAEDTSRADPDDDAARILAVATGGFAAFDPPSSGSTRRLPAVTCLFIARELALRGGPAARAAFQPTCDAAIDGDPLIVSP